MAYDPANPFAGKGAQAGASPYDALRTKATQDAGNNQAQGLDSITRRFAAMGNLNSGAYTKAIEDNSRTATQQAQDAQGKIDVAEQGQALPYAQMQQQESQFGRSLGQSQDQFTKQLAQQGSQFDQEMPLKSRQLDLEANQQQMDAHANSINEELARDQMSHSGGLMGGGGFLGSGLGYQGGGMGNIAGTGSK